MLFIVIMKSINLILLIIIIFLMILLLFRKNLNSILEKLIVFAIIFSLFFLISKDVVITFIGTLIIFLLINLLMGYKKTIENFDDMKDTNFNTHSVAEPAFDKNIFNNDDFLKSSDGIQDLLKKINGGIELKDDDIKESGILNIDTQKYNDDKKPNALKIAQKETYELINTVNALKDTISTLAPVLQEGKKLMNIFENLKL
jgi:energy-coupling factor transporter transmembrane protein EcfT